MTSGSSRLAAQAAATVDFNLAMLSILLKEGGSSSLEAFVASAHAKAAELGRTEEDPCKKALASLQRAGLVYVTEERVRLTSIGFEVGRFLSNS